MARTAQITLDDKVFTVHALNMGELDEVFELFDGPTRKVARGVLAIAMRRAEPKLNGAFDALEPTLDQVTEAFHVIAKLSGIKLENPPPQTGEGGP